MKHIFIVDQSLSRMSKKAIEVKIASLCEKNDMDYSIYFTKIPGDGRHYAKTLENEDTAIVYAVGGDEILNEVLNGIAGSGHMLSIIPYGDGSDFYRTLKEYDKEYILADVGRINGQYFINIACIGLDADIAKRASKIGKVPFFPPSIKYKISMLPTLLTYKFKDLVITLGAHSVTGKYTAVSVCNGRFYGRGVKIATKAQIDNGEFDIYIVEKLPKTSVWGMMLKLLKSQHENDSRVVKYNDSTVEITGKKTLLCIVDGKMIYDNHFKIELVRSAITVHYNKEFIEQLIGTKEKKKEDKK